MTITVVRALSTTAPSAQVWVKPQYAAPPHALYAIYGGESYFVPAGHYGLFDGDIDIQGDLDLEGELHDIQVQAAAATTVVNSPTYSAVAAVSMPAGTPVYVSRANNQLYPADSSTFLSSLVVGFLNAAVTAGFVGTYALEGLYLSDWTAIIGSQLLQTGQTYFLSTNGTMTTTVPTAGGGATLTRVGEALDTNYFLIAQGGLPILL